MINVVLVDSSSTYRWLSRPDVVTAWFLITTSNSASAALEVIAREDRGGRLVQFAQFARQADLLGARGTLLFRGQADGTTPVV